MNRRNASIWAPMADFTGTCIPASVRKKNIARHSANGKSLTHVRGTPARKRRVRPSETPWPMLIEYMLMAGFDTVAACAIVLGSILTPPDGDLNGSRLLSATGGRAVAKVPY